MTIAIEEETAVDFDFDYRGLANDVILYTIDHEDFPYEAEINLTLVDDERIHAVNKEYRGIDRPTDVLSFPMLEYEEAGVFTELEKSVEDNFNPDTGEIILGDIIISIQRVKQQAEEFGHSVKREFAFLIVHSMLHLFGYDHMTEEEAAFMEYKQREILKVLKITR